MPSADTSFDNLVGASIMAARFGSANCPMPYADSSFSGIGGAPFFAATFMLCA
eukprot:CAMPEP_0201964882 /NCGR_PEP_ID=MMETSP0904-20121228/10359_1 /ASSEMBLY_ACC=CAM_ASM_000553 /TAXON_ID=420261 /ORGANISM="Thalassiosira antarctica, Strain CCMP982" /LENGTH=52 /DNA_ID=CAMNT_0048511835 /DNA_START=531 /DNA_END=686 /DNA_ORIENTATION=+